MLSDLVWKKRLYCSAVNSEKICIYYKLNEVNQERNDDVILPHMQLDKLIQNLMQFKLLNGWHACLFWHTKLRHTGGYITKGLAIALRLTSLPIFDLLWITLSIPPNTIIIGYCQATRKEGKLFESIILYSKTMSVSAYHKFNYSHGQRMWNWKCKL